MPTKVSATPCNHAIAAVLHGDSNVDGGDQPVAAGAPSASRCFQAAGACWSSSSNDCDTMMAKPRAAAAAAKSRCHAAAAPLSGRAGSTSYAAPVQRSWKKWLIPT